ncbi:FAS1-like dehydratase domain-containing protein [Enemella dayhoffiae]|nr:MaoC family dehydratase N-terminal domain-containing protein [Enemella dayhoffiae]
MMGDELPGPLASCLGLSGWGRRAKGPVSATSIRIWCEAVGSWNPAHLDPDWAAANLGGLIAPATSLNMWTLHGNRRNFTGREPLDEVTDRLAELGCTSVAAVQSELDFTRPLRPGDHLRLHQSIPAISPRKQTALGEGHFIDVLHDYWTDEDERVGSVLLRMLRWDPSTSPAREREQTAPTEPGSEQAPDPHPDTLRSAELAPGDELPAWRLPITQHLIVALATATYDFNDVHLDRDAARRRGAPDVYMNILGSNALIERYVTDWAGPLARLTSLRTRLRVQNLPGDTLTVTGRVERNEGSTVGLTVTATNSRGPHVLAECDILLPG